MYFLCCLPLLRLIYYENHVSVAPEKLVYFPYGKIFGLMVGAQAVTHNIQTAAFNCTSTAFAALQSNLQKVLDIPLVGFGRLHTRSAIPGKTRTRRF